jgi:hypothetical protein
MSNKPSRFHPEARKEFREATLWYRDRSPVAPTEFRAAVKAVAQQVVQAPKRWPKYLYGTRRVVMQRFRKRTIIASLRDDKAMRRDWFRHHGGRIRGADPPALLIDVSRVRRA